MKSRQYQWLVLTGLLSFALVGSTSFAVGRGGGGAARGGGGGMARGGGARPGGGGGGGGRSAYSGGSIRYSSPSQSASAAPARSAGPSYSGAQRSAVAQRPGAGGGGVQRVAPSGGSYARPTTPAYGAGATARTATPSYGAGARSGTYGYATPTAGGSLTGRSVSQARAPYYTPPTTGSMIHTGSYTTPGGSTIYGAKGPGSGGAVGVKGAEGGTAGAVRGPGGAGAAGVKTAEGGTARAVQGRAGGGAAVARGPEGGTAGAVRGPGGAAAAGVRGPEGGTAGAVRGPAGGGAAGVRGPEGAAAGAVWGPGGYGAAGVRGPYANRVVTNLPAGAVQYPWRGTNYWHAGYGWWQPTWVGDSVCYNWAYPPVGFYYSELPSGYTSVTINGTPYYESEGVYYQEGEQNGQKGYVVAEAPVTPETTEAAAVEGLNPFDVFKSMSDYLGGLEAFSAVAQTTSDEVREDGAKVQISAQRIVYVSRPNRIAMDVTGDSGTKRFVYDGQTASLYDATKNTAMIAKVPDTIEAALDTLAKDYGAVLPLQDLMYKDLYDRVVPRLAAGQYLGLDTVNGVNCHHLGFTSAAADWEIWIDAGEKPVPRKITIDYREPSTRSRYSAEIVQWTESPAFAPTVFEFKPPAGVMEIRLSKAGA